MSKRGLHSVVPEEVATHTLGNRLDQLYTNAAIERWMMLKDRVSDHYPLVLEMKMDKKEWNLDIRSLPTEISQGEMKRLS